MCGLAGIIDFRGRSIDPALLARWTRRLAHRGPDGDATWIGTLGGATVGLAHTRLAVIDLSAAGRQPMFDESGEIGIVYNGEIYNHRELRRRLTADGFAFKTNTDTEVILNAYRRWGERCFEQFNGMWSLAIVDRSNNVGLLARDRYGIKPMVYAVREGQLFFASEMSALACLDEPFGDIDEDALVSYVRLGYVPHPATIFSDVHRLPPGSVLPFSDTDASTPRRYYRLPATASSLSETDAQDALRNAIDGAVTARMVSDVPLGAFLSGGLDSSIIVSHLVEHAGRSVKTFSIGFENQPRYDETAFARLVASKLGTDHHEITVTFDDVIAAIPDLLDHISEPFADASLIPTAILSRHTRDDVTVALSGDGGDELFAGYWRYRGHAFLARYHRAPALLRRAVVEPLARALPAGKSSRLANRVRQFQKLLRASGETPMERHLAWSQILSPEAADRLLAQHARDPLPRYFARNIDDGRDRRRAEDPLNDILETDLLVNLPGDMLHKVDLASMRHALEVRVPFLDRAVVELAMSLPGRYKLAGGRGKRILADAYRDRLPREVLTRPKMGFELPIGEFLRDELRGLFNDVVTPGAIGAFPVLRYEGVQSLYADHLARRGEHADVLYALLVLCWWHTRGRRGWNAGA